MATRRDPDVAPGPKPRVVLFSMPRTGSTMITRQLSRHPDVYFVGALFSIQGWEGDGPGRRIIKDGLGSEWNDLQYRVAHHEELLERVFTIAPSVRCRGFKHHLSGSPKVTQTLIDDARVAKIVLTRSNILACYSSDRMVALKRDHPADAEGPPKVTFDADDFARYLRARRAIYARWDPIIAQSAGSHVAIDYAAARTPEGIAAVMAFIGLPVTQVPQRTLKRNSDMVVSRFANAEAAVAFLEREGLQEWMTEEPAAAPATA